MGAQENEHDGLGRQFGKQKKLKETNKSSLESRVLVQIKNPDTRKHSDGENFSDNDGY